MNNYFDKSEYFEDVSDYPEQLKVTEAEEHSSDGNAFEIDTTYYTVRRARKKLIGYVEEQD